MAAMLLHEQYDALLMNTAFGHSVFRGFQIHEADAYDGIIEVLKALDRTKDYGWLGKVRVW